MSSLADQGRNFIFMFLKPKLCSQCGIVTDKWKINDRFILQEEDKDYLHLNTKVKYL